MEEDFLFYSLFRDQMGSGFSDWLGGRVDLIWRVTEEISGRGLVYERAVHRLNSTEIIRTDYRVYKFIMN